MERPTVDIYEQAAAEYRRRRAPGQRPERPGAFRASVPEGALRADLGCGPGIATPHLGTPVVALDAASAMVALARDAAPGALGVQADLEALPFRRGALDGAWARASYLHVPAVRLPLALADLHRSLAPGAPVALKAFGGVEGAPVEGAVADDDFAGRFFTRWPLDALERVVTGAGFAVETVDDSEPSWPWLHLRRARTLPDTVGPGMAVLVCGLNPSLHAADAGYGYAGPGNRFWPAAVAAGLVAPERARDPFAVARQDGVGMTDLVKRATVGADEVAPDEYRAGAERVRRLVEWLRPEVVCFAGLGGYRLAVDRRATVGWQDEPFGGARASVMPSPSGRNARTSLAELTTHLEGVVRALGGV